jgi:hypothetical protein
MRDCVYKLLMSKAVIYEWPIVEPPYLSERIG